MNNLIIFILLLLIVTGANASEPVVHHRSVKLENSQEMHSWRPRFSSLQEWSEFIASLGYRVVSKHSSTDHYTVVFDAGDGAIGMAAYCTLPEKYPNGGYGANPPKGSSLAAPVSDRSQLIVKYALESQSEKSKYQFSWGPIYKIRPDYTGPIHLTYTAWDANSKKARVTVLDTLVTWPSPK